MKKLNLSLEISEYDPEPFGSLSNSYICHYATPAYDFVTVFVMLDDAFFCVSTTARNSFDHDLAHSMLLFIFQNQSVISPSTPLATLRGFVCNDNDFDMIVVLSPRVANRYENENTLLNERSFFFFPAYQCEFSGDENPETAALICSDFLDYVDWDRLPSPKILVRPYVISSHRHSYLRNSGFSTFENMIVTIEEHLKNKDCGIEIQNYSDNICRITKHNDSYMVDFSSNLHFVFSMYQLEIILRNFLVHNRFPVQRS